MGFNDWPQMQCVRLRAKRCGTPSLVYNAKENLRANESMGRQGEITKFPCQALHKTLNTFNMSQTTCQR
jgi:hypothetical protein